MQPLEPMLSTELRDMRARALVYRSECLRRGVKFLPEQVTRQLFDKAGLSCGPMLSKSRLDSLEFRLERWRKWYAKF